VKSRRDCFGHSAWCVAVIREEERRLNQFEFHDGPSFGGSYEVNARVQQSSEWFLTQERFGESDGVGLGNHGLSVMRSTIIRA